MAGLSAILDRDSTAGTAAVPCWCGRTRLLLVLRVAQRCVTSRGQLHSSSIKCSYGQMLAVHSAWRAACTAKASELVRDLLGVCGCPREVTCEK